MVKEIALQRQYTLILNIHVYTSLEMIKMRRHHISRHAGVKLVENFKYHAKQRSALNDTRVTDCTCHFKPCSAGHR